jgi:lipopolysaccharide/colanic/teichoic acid biosynthesis glycosyltransferase
MSPTNSNELYSQHSPEITPTPVIKMNPSDRAAAPALPPFYEKFLRSVPRQKTKLIPFLPLEKKSSRLIKRGIDIVISTVMIIVLLSWFIPLMALLIKLSSKGPVFFLQKRSGRDGKLFTCIKLRTMKVNAESDIKAAEANDKRITKLGKFLRRHYLDELPQFLNVLMGEMSVIGPRPHMISDNAKFENLVAHYEFRHKVKPGITGLAQVLGFAGPVDDFQKIKDRVQLDIFYIRHWSLWLDMRIIFRTIRKLI